MADFLQDYFLTPLRTSGAEQFNLINLAFYAGLGLLLLFLLFSALRFFKIKVDKSFFLAVLSFVPFGAFLVVFCDAGILPRSLNLFGFEFFPFVPPVAFLTVFVFIVFFFFVSKLVMVLWKNLKIDEIKLTYIFGSVLSISCLLFFLFSFEIKNWICFLSIPLAFMPLVFFLFFKGDFFQKLAVFSQSFDGAITFFAMQFFGYREQLFLSDFIISIAGPFSFFLAKAVLSFAVVFFVKKEVLEKEEYIYILLLITIFGLSPALRNLLRISIRV